jgi:hypothetical protein
MQQYGRLVNELCNQTALSYGKFYVYISNPAMAANIHLKSEQ